MTEQAGNFVGGLRTASRDSVVRVLALAFVLRTLWILVCRNEPVSDQHVYHVSATSILSGKGFTFEDGDAIWFWPVGYSVALAGVYAALGVSVTSAYAFNLLLGVATTWLTYLLGSELYGRRVGLLSALVIAVYPSFVAFTTVIASENLYIPLWIGSIYCLVRAQAGGIVSKWSVGCGIVAGFASLVRPTALVFPMLVFATGLFYRNRLAKCFGHAALVLALVLVIGLPWALRNQREFGEFSYAPFNGGVCLWIGNHAGADGQNITGDLTKWGAPQKEGISVPAYDRAMQQAAVRYVEEHPLDAIRLVVLRSYHTLKAETIAVVWNAPGIAKAFGERMLMPLKIVTTLGYLLVMVSALAALVRRAVARSLSRSDLLVVAAIGAASIPFLVVLGMDRYHLPLIPLVAILASSLPGGNVAPTAARS